MNPNAVLHLNYDRHPGQAEVLFGMLKADADINTIIAARGWGKTLFTTCDIVVETLFNTPGSQVMWVAPTYKIAKAPIDDVWFGSNEKTGLRYIPQYDENTGIQLWEWKAVDMELHVCNGSKMYLRSADNPASIVAKGYNLIVIDEAAQISKEVFMQYILPTARREGCKIVLITTPRGKNWIYEMYLAGQDRAKTGYYSARQPWWKRPDFPEVLKRLMKDMPEHLRQQEFEAEFISDSTGVFKNLAKVFEGEEIWNDTWEAPITQAEMDMETRICAVDLAKQADYTVIVVMGTESKRIFYYERFNKTSYQNVLEKVRRVCKKYDADLIYDATGVGQGVGDFLQGEMNVHPFTFTNQSKNELVNKLAVACEYDEIKLPNIAPMRQEFELFTFKITKTGLLSYGAPEGKHDDTVMAVGMANWYAAENSGKANVETIDDFIMVMDNVHRPKTRLEQLIEEDD